MKKLVFIVLYGVLSVLMMSQNTTVTDCQGYEYPVVKMGSQYWMAENLQCTKYDTQSERAGAIIPISSIKTYEPYFIDGRYATTDYSESLTQEQRNHLGLLYNWAAAFGCSESQIQNYIGSYSDRRQGICPNGWHLPNRAELSTLAHTLGGVPETSSNGNVKYLNVGEKLKSKGGWYNDSNGTDDYGFCGLPAGFANGGNVLEVGRWGFFWLSDDRSSDCAYVCFFNSFGEGYVIKNNALSVRCVKNSNVDKETVQPTYDSKKTLPGLTIIPSKK